MTTTDSTIDTPSGPPAAGTDSRAAGLARWARMAGFEARVLMRRRTTVLSVLSGPALMIFFPLVQKPPDALAWAAIAGVAGLIGLLVSTYSTATSVLTLRRESGVLNRQRTTELTGAQIVTAAAAPLFAVGAVQTIVIYAVYLLMGAPAPVNPALVGIAAVVGGLFCVAAAAATCTVSRSAEGVQYSVLPLLLGAAIGANLVASPLLPDGVRAMVLLIPGTPVADLVARGWIGDAPGLAVYPVPAVVADLVLIAAWSLLAVLVARLRWRWTARG